jgi:hypothetical protein
MTSTIACTDRHFNDFMIPFTNFLSGIRVQRHPTPSPMSLWRAWSDLFLLFAYSDLIELIASKVTGNNTRLVGHTALSHYLIYHPCAVSQLISHTSLGWPTCIVSALSS